MPVGDGGAAAEVLLAAPVGGRLRRVLGALLVLGEDAVGVGGVGVAVVGAGVERGAVLGADGDRQAVVEGVEVDEVAEHVALHREQEGVRRSLSGA